MLTLKLKNTRSGRTTIVETRSVDVLPLQGGGQSVECRNLEDTGSDRYEIKPGGDYDVAYVENSRGATTQVIR